MTPKLKVWADDVKARDGKCMECGTLHDLHAHHIKPKAAHPELTLDLSNGKTLCYRCHKAEHERNRPPRIRTDRPQRKSLEKRIQFLEAEIKMVKSSYLGKIQRLSRLVGECERGSCKSCLALIRKHNEGY